MSDWYQPKCHWKNDANTESWNKCKMNYTIKNVTLSFFKIRECTVEKIDF